MTPPKSTIALGRALSGADQSRIYPANPGGIAGAILREGVVSGAPTALTVPVKIGGSNVVVPIRYLGDCAPINGAKVVVVMLGQMIYCLPTSSDNTMKPVATAYQTTAQSMTSGTESVLHYDTVIDDPNGNFNASTGTYTCPSKGWYHVDASFMLNTALTAGQMIATIRINGGGGKRIGDLKLAAGYLISGGSLIKCNASDTITISGYQDSGSPINTFAGSQLMWFDVELRRSA